MTKLNMDACVGDAIVKPISAHAVRQFSRCQEHGLRCDLEHELEHLGGSCCKFSKLMDKYLL